jgi:hypothetical protein
MLRIQIAIDCPGPLFSNKLLLLVIVTAAQQENKTGILVVVQTWLLPL